VGFKFTGYRESFIIDEVMLMMQWIAIQNKKIYRSGVLKKDVNNRDILHIAANRFMISGGPAPAPLHNWVQRLP